MLAKDDTDGRILAYQVHMLRKQWNKTSETKAIKAIIGDLKEQNPQITETEMIKQLREITSHKRKQLEDILILLEYDDLIIEKVLSEKLDMSYLIQIKNSFIKPLKRKFPQLLEKYSENDLRNILVDKVENKLIPKARYFMDKFNVVFKDDDHDKQIAAIINDFLSKKSMGIEKAWEDWENLKKSVTNTASEKHEATVAKKEKPPASVKTSPRTFQKITLSVKEQSSLRTVRRHYEEIGKALSENEKEYIAEGINCLEYSCFKASTVMIWAAGIDRLINFIVKKGFTDFNDASIAMSNVRKSPYSYVKSYKTNITLEDDLRDGNDWQLLLYLLYKKIITTTQFDKLKADYKTRCNCAHPTDIDLSSNEVIVIYNNVFNLLFNNSKML